jgi:hypothetical protein
MPSLKEIGVLSVLSEDELSEFFELIQNAEVSYFIYLDELGRLLKFFKKKKTELEKDGNDKAVNMLSDFISNLEKMVDGLQTPQSMILEASGALSKDKKL